MGGADAEVEEEPVGPLGRLDIEEAAERAGRPEAAEGSGDSRDVEEPTDGLRAGEGCAELAAVAALALDEEGSADRPRARSAHDRVAMTW